MSATIQQFREILDESWKCDYEEALECDKCEKLIARVHELWDGDRQVFSSTVPGPRNRDEMRAYADSLRMAERAMNAILGRAAKSVAKGYTVEGLERLIACIYEARTLIVLPMARRMATRDPEGREAHQIAQLLVKQVRFQDGRAIITEEIAAKFPSPFEVEPAA